MGASVNVPYMVGVDDEGNLVPGITGSFLTPAQRPNQRMWMVERTRDASQPTWTPAKVGGRHAGFKVVLQDLPSGVSVGRVNDWIQRDPSLQAAFPNIRNNMIDMTVSGGSTSGDRKAIVVMNSPESALAIYRAFQRWYVPAATPKGYKWLGTYYIVK